MKKFFSTYPNLIENKRITMEGLTNNAKCCDIEKEVTKEMLGEKSFNATYADIISKTSLAERVDLLISSLNLIPQNLTPLCKIILLSRLVLFNRHNFVAFQLSQPGLGKSFLFESTFKGAYNHTGATTAAALFGSNSNQKNKGILEQHHTVNVDEVILKGSTSNFVGCDEKFRGFTNNGSINRDGEERFSKTSVMFTGNLYDEQEILFRLPYEFENNIGILSNLTPVLNNDAIKDRVHALFPLWAVKKPSISRHNDCYGLNSNFLENVLLEQREHSFIKNSTALSKFESSGRDYNRILTTFNGLLVLLFPNKDYTDMDYQALLSLAIFFKKLITDELYPLHNSPEYCYFMLKISEPYLPFKISDISEIFPSFDRIVVKLHNDRDFIYTIPLTMFGEKISRKEYSLSTNPKYADIIAKMEIVPSDLFILKHHSTSIYQKKGIILSEFFDKKEVWEDIEDDNVKSILKKLIKTIEKLETDVNQIKKTEKLNFKYTNKMLRNTLIEFDEVKEAYNSIVDIINTDYVDRHNKTVLRENSKRIEPLLFLESEFPLDNETTSNQCSSILIDEIASFFKCSSSKVEEQLLSYDDNLNSLKLISFHDLLPCE